MNITRKINSTYLLIGLCSGPSTIPSPAGPRLARTSCTALYPLGLYTSQACLWTIYYTGIYR